MNDLIFMSEKRKDRLLYKPVLVWILSIGFLQHGSPDHFSEKKKRLDFRDVLRKIAHLLAREQMLLDGWIFVYFGDILQTACLETESKIHSILGCFRLFLQSTLLIRRRLTCD